VAPAAGVFRVTAGCPPDGGGGDDEVDEPVHPANQTAPAIITKTRIFIIAPRPDRALNAARLVASGFFYRTTMIEAITILGIRADCQTVRQHPTPISK
jgi:hypothetical protein